MMCGGETVRKWCQGINTCSKFNYIYLAFMFYIASHTNWPPKWKKNTGNLWWYDGQGQTWKKQNVVCQNGNQICPLK